MGLGAGLGMGLGTGFRTGLGAGLGMGLRTGLGSSLGTGRGTGPVRGLGTGLGLGLRTGLGTGLALGCHRAALRRGRRLVATHRRRPRPRRRPRRGLGEVQPHAAGEVPQPDDRTVADLHPLDPASVRERAVRAAEVLDDPRSADAADRDVPPGDSAVDGRDVGLLIAPHGIAPGRVQGPGASIGMQYKFRHVCPKSIVCTEAVCVRIVDGSDGSCGSCGSAGFPDGPGTGGRHTVCGARRPKCSSGVTAVLCPRGVGQSVCGPDRARRRVRP